MIGQVKQQHELMICFGPGQNHLTTLYNQRKCASSGEVIDKLEGFLKRAVTTYEKDVKLGTMTHDLVDQIISRLRDSLVEQDPRKYGVIRTYEELMTVEVRQTTAA